MKSSLMIIKKTILLMAVAALILSLMGCGKNTDNTENKPGKTESAQETSGEEAAGSGTGSDLEKTPESDAVETDAEEISGANDKAPVEVFNNGGNFVKAGTKVYYRQYEANAYGEAVLFGEFINGMSAGQDCFIMCYDEASGKEAEKVMADDGEGPLVYENGRLFSTYNVDYTAYYVYVLDPVTQTSYKICDGQIAYVDPETGRYVVRNEHDQIVDLSVYKGAELLDSFSAEEIDPFKELHLQGDYLVYRAALGNILSSDEEGSDQLRVRDIREKTDLLLGELPTVEDEYGSYYGKDIDQIVICEDTVYVAVGFYAGTGYFYNDGYFCKASLKQENSLEIVDHDTIPVVTWAEYPYDATNILESALPELFFTDRQLYSVSQNYETGYINVLLPSNAATEPVKKDVVQIPGTTGEDSNMLIEKKEYVDGAVYMIIDDVEYNPQESIGWRDAYNAKSVRYVRADVETGDMVDIQPAVNIAGNVDDLAFDSFLYYYIENPAAGESYGTSDKVAVPISFTELSRGESEYIDENRWLAENGFSSEDLDCPGYTFGLRNEYDRDTHRGYRLWVYSEDFPYAVIDLSDFYDPVNCLESEYLDTGWNAEYQYAYVEDNILYVAMYHMTYADSMPYNAYIIAIDLSDGTLLWKSRPLTCNSRDFLLMDDVIICGYGFTAEDDFLYQLSKYTGEIVQTIPLKSKAYYIFYRDEHLYVQTYNTAYDFMRQ